MQTCPADWTDPLLVPVLNPKCPSCGGTSIAETGGTVRCVGCLQLLVRVPGGFRLRFDWMQAGRRRN